MWEGEAFHCPVIRSQSLNKLVPLDCEFHKCFSGLFCLFVFSHPLRGTRWSEWTGVGYFSSLKSIRF